MFEPNSRYYSLEGAQITLPDGRTVSYKKRRFLPQGEDLPLLVEVRTAQGERLDLLTHRTLGDPLQYWRIADANNAMDPFDLVAEIDVPVKVPIPTF